MGVCVHVRVAVVPLGHLVGGLLATVGVCCSGNRVISCHPTSLRVIGVGVDSAVG